MTTFAHRCGIATPERDQAIARVAEQLQSHNIELVRFAWCDLHGSLRSKTLVASSAVKALHEGVGMVSTLLLKDTSDRTAFKVFEAGGMGDLLGFEGATNLLMLADPGSFRVLPWADKTAWLQCQPYFANGQIVPVDTRHVLQQALQKLAQQGLGMQCGLEVEFHIYKITDPTPQTDPDQAAWPGLPPQVDMIHPGYQLLSDAYTDACDEPLSIVQRTAQALGLPLLSLEVEFGPSQVEAVFDVTDALTAADNMVRFRNGVRQALRRAGYHATFMCRPPFPHIMSSGWHLHQSLVSLNDGDNAFMREAPQAGSTPTDAAHTLSTTGCHYLAGLLAHAQGAAVFATPTVNGYGRYQPNALAPQAALWGYDNRGAMLRVIGAAGDPATRIENRLGEPAANPYLYIASQIHAGLDGVRRQLAPPRATLSPYAGDVPEANKLPSSLAQTLTALQADDALMAAFGPGFAAYLVRIKQVELARYDAAQDKVDFERREYFSRI